MMAQAHTGRTEIVALRHGYSGRSMLAQSLDRRTRRGARCRRRSPASSTRRALLLPLPARPHVPVLRHRVREGHRGADPDDDDGQHRRASSPSRSWASAASSRRPPEYFEIAVGIVRKYGGVFICDEVQTGFGRTGGKMWGIEHWGVEPDIMTMAKGIANGLPARRHDRDARDRRRR